MTNNNQLTTVMKMKLASMDNLVRMAFFSSVRNSGLNFLLYKVKETNRWHIGFLTGVAGYFELRGLPMLFYVELDDKPKNGSFIKYSSTDSEKWSYTDSTQMASTIWSFLPIIELAEKPSFF